MSLQVIKPSRILSEFVRYYWTLEDVDVQTPCQYRVIPQGCIELLFFYGARYKAVDSGKSSCFLHPRAVVAGQQSGYYDLAATGAIGIFSVLFKPHGARLFFVPPLCDATDKVVALKELAGKTADEFEDRMLNARNARQRVLIVENFLVARIIEKEYDGFKRVSAVVDTIKSKRGNIAVPPLANAACLSEKQFERTFCKYTGMSPKQYLKIVRFQNVLHVKQLNPSLSLTALAFECGYFDQAHFVKDFKSITGIVPTAYFEQCAPYSDFFVER